MLQKLIFPLAMVLLTAACVYAALPRASVDSFAGVSPGDLARLSPAAGAPALAPHKALYDMEMTEVESGAGIVGIRGHMYYEQDDACDAWTTDQRFTMEYQYPERRPVNSTSHYVTWEGKDGKRFEYTSERQENGQVTEVLRGGARMKDDGGRAEYIRPEGLVFSLAGGTLFPATHTMEIIRRAGAGETFFTLPLFDGTDDRGPVETGVVIGKKADEAEITALAQKAGGKIAAALLTPRAWHVRVAVFPVEDKDALTPSYEMDMVLHDNGVVSSAVVNYKSFKVAQRLATATPLPEKDCQE